MVLRRSGCGGGGENCCKGDRYNCFTNVILKCFLVGVVGVVVMMVVIVVVLKLYWVW